MSGRRKKGFEIFIFADTIGDYHCNEENLLMRKGKRRAKSRKYILMTIACIAVVTVVVLFSLNCIAEKNGAWKPDYAEIDLMGIALQDKPLTDADYRLLFLQTGLGKPAVTVLWSDPSKEHLAQVLRQYQQNFFSPDHIVCKKIGIITSEERIRNQSGSLVQSFEIPNLQDGDILITKSTHSLGWQHGHAAIVTDASKGETLEAILLGKPSILQNISKWQSYSTFIQLRLRDDETGTAKQISEYAKENLVDLTYSLMTGVPRKAPKEIKKTQCSHLVWYPYYHFGYDIDSDGSWLVTPKDIANSDYFEIVQVFGVNPEEIWP